MTEFVNFIFHIMKISNFWHKLAYKAGGAFLKSFSIFNLNSRKRNAVDKITDSFLLTFYY